MTDEKAGHVPLIAEKIARALDTDKFDPELSAELSRIIGKPPTKEELERVLLGAKDMSLTDEEWCKLERVPRNLLERARAWQDKTFHASGHEFDGRALALAFRDVRDDALEEAAVTSERGDDSAERIRKLKSKQP
jgi:hypothetical protein